MLMIWENMGFIRWPLGFSLVSVVGLALYSLARLSRPGATADLISKAWVDAILFWGAFAMIAGVLGTLVGIVVAAQSVEAAGVVAPTLVWGGIKIAMLSSAFGTMTLAVSALVWFTLQLRWRFLEAAAMGEGRREFEAEVVL